MLAIGPKLTFLRTRQGITQAELSKRTGIPQANLSRIERGQQDPAVSTLLRICRALGVPPADFFKEESPATRPLFTRTSMEKMARGVLDPSIRLSAGPSEIAALLRDLVPGARKRRPSAQRIYSAWYALKKRLTNEEIRVLIERIQDAKARLDAAKPD